LLAVTAIYVSMTNMKMAHGTKPRPYIQTARAEAAEANRRRMIDAFLVSMRDRWLDEITLDAVAAAAGVTVQTVIRRFGNKDGLIEAASAQLDEEISIRRAARPGDVEAAVTGLVSDYELTGDVAIRMLAQEPRHQALRRPLDRARANHRAWVTTAFGPRLSGLPTEERERRVTALVAMTDVYVWKLLRRDMALEPDSVIAIVRDAVVRLVADPGIPAPPPSLLDEER
jgi:AcrR family transcriptional regulator